MSRFHTALLLVCLGACGGVVEATSSAGTGGGDTAVDEQAPGGTSGVGEAGGDAGSSSAAGTGGAGAADASADGDCAGATKICDNACVSTDDPAYGCTAAGCAPCALAHALATCASGKCVIESCESGWEDCDGSTANGCEQDVSADIDNCGQCGNECQPTVLPWGARCCYKGGCYLPENPSGSLDCDCDPSNGSEISGLTDPNNCGGCGDVCLLPHAASACNNASCVVSGCDLGWGDCDGLSSNGCELDLSNDAAHCGNCETACVAAPHATPACASGQCVIGGCESGWGDCDGNAANGCEQDVSADVDNCGKCGIGCGLMACCFQGACYVPMGSFPAMDCDCNPLNGAETNLAYDPDNCGKCGNVCALSHATSYCNAMVCEVASCDAGWAECDGFDSTGCETDLLTDTSNCGSCGVACTSGQSCASGVCS